MASKSRFQRSGVIFLSAVLSSFYTVTSFGQTSHHVEVTSNIYTPDDITINVGDTVIWTNTQGNHNVNGNKGTFPDNPESFGNSTGFGWTFSHVFTVPGTYDYQCDPHVNLDMVGTVNVTDEASEILTVNFESMTPHVGQELYVALVEKETGEIVDRESRTVETSFSVQLDDYNSGLSYWVDIYADHNSNGIYDAPPLDHAWRLETEGGSFTESINFTHNTNFTDIEWKHRLKVSFSGMIPHVGQTLTLYVRDLATGDYLDTIVESEVEATFDVVSYVVEPEKAYQVDFYTDHNGNGMYDSPPTDHAWSIETGTSSGDIELDFMHNTNFTDIFEGTSTNEIGFPEGLTIYPNPLKDALNIQSSMNISSLSVFTATGIEIRTLNQIDSEHVNLFLGDIPYGYYILKIVGQNQTIKVVKILKQ